jgi:hypothetical protein
MSTIHVYKRMSVHAPARETAAPTVFMVWLRACVSQRRRPHSGRIVALGSTESLTEMSNRNPPWELRRPVRRADNLTTFLCRLSKISGASTSWNPNGLSRPVAGKLYLYFYWVPEVALLSVSTPQVRAILLQSRGNLNLLLTWLRY